MPFCLLLVWRATLLLNALEAVSLLQALSAAVLIALTIGGLMIFSRSAFFLLGLVVSGYLLIDAQGQALALRGAAIWLASGTLAFLLTLSAATRFITPPFNNVTSFPALRLLLREALPWRSKTGVPHAVGSIPKSFETLRAGEVPAHQVYAIYQGINYLSAIGPGWVAMERNQYVRAVYDLRPQSRSMPLRVTTHDGITLDTTINVRFALRKRANAGDEAGPYPYDSTAVRQLVENEVATSVAGGERTVAVFDRVAARAALYAADEVAHHTLDRLLQVNDAAHQTLQLINERVLNETTQFFRDKGLEIGAARIGALQLPKAIEQARVEHWKRGWKQPVATRPNKAIQRISKDEAEAQLAVVYDLFENLKTLQAASSNLPAQEELMQRIGAIITDAATEGLLSTLIPPPKRAEGKG